jgi:sec-independent protein translocase protein TatB
MFDVGFPELVLLFVIALLVLGPQRLPKVAAELGKWVSRARRTATQLRRQLEREIELSDLQPPKPPPRPDAPAAPESAAQTADAAAAEPPVDPPSAAATADVAPPAPSEAPPASPPPEAVDKPLA